MLKNRLKKILAKEGIKQVELARKSGLSTATIYKVAKRQHPVLHSTKARIVRALNDLTGGNLRVSDVFLRPPRRHVEITIDKPYEEFSESDERALLEFIRKATGDHSAKILSKSR